MAKKKKEPIDYSQFPYVYEMNISTGEINLWKSEIPSEVNNFFTENNKIVKPPWDPYELEWLAMQDGTHRRCIELKATLIAGFGYYIRNKDHKNYDKLVEFLDRPNENFGDTFSKISVNVKRSENTYGAGGLFINKALDKIQMFASTNMKSIFVIPKNFRGRKSINIRKFIQVSKNGNYSVEFFPYDGKPLTGRKYLYRFGYKTFSNSYYPEPSYIAIKGKIFEDLLIDQNDIDWFKNRARMDMAILISGVKLDAKGRKAIREKYQEEMKGFKGPFNQHKTAIFTVGKGGKLEIVDLAKNEDGQYSIRQNTLEYSIARSHGIMPKLILLLSSGSSGFQGGSASIGDLFLENQIMIRPEQEDYENDWNLIFKSLFGFDPGIKFKTIDTNNQKDMAIILSTIANLKLIGKIEGRQYIADHGIMEIDPDIMPEDIIETNSINPNSDGDIRNPDGSLEQKPDDETSIDENKFKKKE